MIITTDASGAIVVNQDKGGSYFDAADLAANQIGGWFPTHEFRDVALSLQLMQGIGTITGQLYAEFTADPARSIGVSRVIMPPGCLHTDLAGVVLATTGLQADLTAASSGSFSVAFKLAAGSLRFRWAKTGGSGAAPNTLSGVVQVRRIIATE